MVYRSDTVDSEGHLRLKGNESANGFGQADGSGTDFSRRPSAGFKEKKGEK